VTHNQKEKKDDNEIQAGTQALYAHMKKKCIHKLKHRTAKKKKKRKKSKHHKNVDSLEQFWVGQCCRCTNHCYRCEVSNNSALR
jgi:uncharacterized protein (DUF1697 family)